ncbi:MAG: hypothetical protein IKZ96_04400 [Bacilli bacterium]|nr:hypothetical protein [Bacilli bacterium]
MYQINIFRRWYSIKRLNIFVDETGEFGFGLGSSELYGISFTFHDQDDDIGSELDKLNNRLKRIGYSKMIHMADLIMRRNEYSKMSIETRKSIFNSIYQFSRRILVKYRTIIIDKRYTDNTRVLKGNITKEIDSMIKEQELFFRRYDYIVLYYDNGQEILGTILDALFSRFDNYEHRIDFNHVEKRLFQVSDMLTYIDKYDYKYKNSMSFSKSEKYFFTNEEIRKIIKELNKKRF